MQKTSVIAVAIAVAITLALALSVAAPVSASATSDNSARSCPAAKPIPPAPSTPTDPTGPTDPQCPLQPTRNIDLVVNLDPIEYAAAESLVRPDRPIVHSTRISIVDLDENPASIEVRWTSIPGSTQWTVQAAHTALGDAGFPSIPLRRLQGEPSDFPFRLAFDGAGELIGSTHGEFEIEAADGRVQPIRIAFETERGRTTQYDHPFVELEVRVDGFDCPDTSDEAMACGVARGLLDPADDGIAETVRLSDEGVLLSNRGQHVQGFAGDILTGEFDATLSNVQLPNGLSPPLPTTRARFVLTLDQNQPVLARDPRIDQILDGAYEADIFRIPYTYYGPLGQRLDSEINLFRSGENSWAWYGQDSQSAIIRLIFAGREEALDAYLAEHRGEILFGVDGVLEEVRYAGHAISANEFPVIEPATRTWLVSAASSLRDSITPAIEIDFGVGTTRLGSADRVEVLRTNGAGAGFLTGFRLRSTGELEAYAANGRTHMLSRLAPARGGLARCQFECSDGKDDDRDGNRDFPRDAGCSSPLDGSETSSRFACDDGIDNDGDGLIDARRDPGCDSPTGMSEGVADLELKIVKRETYRTPQEIEVVVAVMNGGNARTLESIIPSTLQAESPSMYAIPDATFIGPDETDRRDIDCDGNPDRLFRLRLPGHERAPKALCVSGKTSPHIVGFSGRFGTRLSDLFIHSSTDEFRACTKAARRVPRSEPD